MTRRLATMFGSAALALLAILGAATPAAAVTSGEKLAVMATFTQSSASSYNTWNAARQNQAA